MRSGTVGDVGARALVVGEVGGKSAYPAMNHLARVLIVVASLCHLIACTDFTPTRRRTRDRADLRRRP